MDVFGTSNTVRLTQSDIHFRFDMMNDVTMYRLLSKIMEKRKQSVSKQKWQLLACPISIKFATNIRKHLRRRSGLGRCKIEFVLNFRHVSDSMLVDVCGWVCMLAPCAVLPSSDMSSGRAMRLCCLCVCN